MSLKNLTVQKAEAVENICIQEKKYLILGERTALKQTGSDYTQLTLLELAINTKNLSLVRGQETSAVNLNPQYGHAILKVR